MTLTQTQALASAAISALDRIEEHDFNSTEQFEAAIAAIREYLVRVGGDAARIEALESLLRSGEDVALGADADGSIRLTVGMVTEIVSTTYANEGMKDLREAIDDAARSTPPDAGETPA